MEHQSLLGTLGIDWKLFVGQLINFSIVLFVFWKWIVKPLGQTLTKRQERIEQGLKNAVLMDEEKKKFEEWKQAEMRKIRGEADQVLRLASDTANKTKQEIIFDAQKQSETLLRQAENSIESQKQQMLKEVKQEVATLVVMASEKILRAKLDPKKDHELINESLNGIK
ncbi:MAG: F0F1 ATP synthase subunit B [Candidatus Doudnabacteria bacterium]|nr:F0F1 ATP synthase subunit B [Candidatus Doudnabacteria bacterium]